MRTLHQEFYLVFKKKDRGAWRNNELTVRASTSKPALAKGEVSVQVQVGIPDAAFDRPTLKAELTIPEEMVTPAPIEMEAVSGIVEAVREQLIGDE